VIAVCQDSNVTPHELLNGHSIDLDNVQVIAKGKYWHEKSILLFLLYFFLFDFHSFYHIYFNDRTLYLLTIKDCRLQIKDYSLSKIADWQSQAVVILNYFNPGRFFFNFELTIVFVEFIFQVKGLNGTYLANVYLEDAFTGRGKVKSMITFNKGAQWFPLKAPSVDHNGDPTNCHPVSHVM